jgi:hypothetical protein
MEKVLEKLESLVEGYVTSLADNPIKTVIKTMAIIWLINQVKKMLK